MVVAIYSFKAFQFPLFSTLSVVNVQKKIIVFFYIDYFTSGFLFDFTFLVNGLCVFCCLCPIVMVLAVGRWLLVCGHCRCHQYCCSMRSAQCGICCFLLPCWFYSFHKYFPYIDYQRAKTNFQSFKTGRKLRSSLYSIEHSSSFAWCNVYTGALFLYVYTIFCIFFSPSSFSFSHRIGLQYLC